jgi:hypothetical protein
MLLTNKARPHAHAKVVAKFYESGCRFKQIDEGPDLAASKPLRSQIHQQGTNI